MPKKNSEQLYIYGRNPVEEIVADYPELVRHVYLKDTMEQGLLRHAKEELKQAKIHTSIVPEKKLKEFVPDGSVHQGIVAELHQFPYQDFHDWFDHCNMAHPPLVFILNEIQDPHNVGAIIRSAVAFGVDAVLIPTHRQASITSTVYKASAGTAHKIPIIPIGNTNQTIETLKKNKFWIGGIDSEADMPIYNEDFSTPVAIVVGSEGGGMREKTKEHCDYLVSIPIDPAVESLNASVAAGVIAYEYQRKLHGRS